MALIWDPFSGQSWWDADFITARREFEGGSLTVLGTSKQALGSVCEVGSPVTSPRGGVQEMGFCAFPHSLHSPPRPPPSPSHTSYKRSSQPCWIVLMIRKWKLRQTWFGLETTQAFKRSQQESLGLACFLCFHNAQTSPKGKQYSYPESKHLCF